MVLYSNPALKYTSMAYLSLKLLPDESRLYAGTTLSSFSLQLNSKQIHLLALFHTDCKTVSPNFRLSWLPKFRLYYMHFILRLLPPILNVFVDVSNRNFILFSLNFVLRSRFFVVFSRLIFCFRVFFFFFFGVFIFFVFWA